MTTPSAPTNLLAVYNTILPWLTLNEAVRLSVCSSDFFHQLQKNKEFWRALDFSNVRTICPVSALLALQSSSLSRKGALVNGVSFAFSNAVSDESLQLLCDKVGSQQLKDKSSGSGGIALSYLNLNGCTKITDTGLRYLANVIHGLEALELYYNVKITDKGLVPLIERNRATLKRLNLSGCRHISDDSLKSLARYCGSRLIDLDLTRTTGMSNVGLAFICASLHELRRLRLYACHHLPAGSFKGLSHCERLEELDLCGCLVTDDDVKALFSRCRQLKVLNLTWCTKLTDNALRFIADEGSSESTPLTGLTSLSLHGVSTITSEGLEALINSRHQYTLEALDVRGCVELEPKFLSDHFKGLKEAFPNLRIFNLHS